MKTSTKKESSKQKNEITKDNKKSERTENIVAVAVFILLILLGVAIPTKGFGLFEKKIDSGERINVPLSLNDPYTGSTNASIALVVFSDYSCPNCKSGEEITKSLMSKYPDKIIYVFKDLPLTRIHPNSYNSALAAECAKEQGKYWEYHDYLFEHQEQQELQYLKEYAKLLGLDSEKFNNCFEEQKYKKEVDEDVKTAALVGVSGTPTFFINGIMVVGAQPEEEFIKIINSELERKG
jgi:protein-disulfide isomerase